MIRILIVDDDENYLNSLVDALGTLGRFEILHVTKSIEAFKFINDGVIDVLITDYLLKNDVLNGDKIIRTIRDKERHDDYHSYLPCILMTGSEGERQMVTRLIDLKSLFYSKGDDVTLLVDKIEESWKEKQARERKSIVSVISSVPDTVAVTTNEKNTYWWRLILFLFVNLPRLLGRAVLDILGRDKAAEATASIIGYAIVATVLLITCGAIEYATIISSVKSIWLFFFSAKGTS